LPAEENTGPSRKGCIETATEIKKKKRGGRRAQDVERRCFRHIAEPPFGGGKKALRPRKGERDKSSPLGEGTPCSTSGNLRTAGGKKNEL